MNIFEKIYQNKLSIYDLLVEKNKEKKKNSKDLLQKRLSSKLSEIKSRYTAKINSQDLAKKNHQNKPKNDELSYNFAENKLIKHNLNVFMKGESLQEKMNNYQKKDDVLLMKVEETHLGLESKNIQLKDIQNSKSLGLISDFGTTQKYNFSRRPEKSIPSSTLKIKNRQILPNINVQRSVEMLNSYRQNDLQLPEFIDDNLDEDFEKVSSEEKTLDVDQKQSKIRSVDEIIASLKSDDYIQNQLKSEKRIDDLIRNVLNRTDEDEYQEKEEKKVIHDYENLDQYDVQNNVVIPMESKSISPEFENDGNLFETDIEHKSEIQTDECISHIIVEKNRDDVAEMNMTKFDLDQILSDFENNVNVTNEDLLGIKGSQLSLKCLANRTVSKNISNMKISVNKSEFHKGIHELCTLNQYPRISTISQRNIWTEKYVPDRYHKKFIDTQNNASTTDRIDKAAERVIHEKDEIEKWRKKAKEMLNNNSKIEVIGTYIFPAEPRISNIWQPMSPKLRMTPNRVREILCPAYNKNFQDFDVEEMSRENTFENMKSDDLQLIEDSSLYEDIDLFALQTKKKLLCRRNNSYENINIHSCNQQEVRVMKRYKRKRFSSVPNRHCLEEDSLIINLEYHQLMEEINMQKQKILILKNISNSYDEPIPEEKSDRNQEPILVDSENIVRNEKQDEFHENQTFIKDLDKIQSAAERALLAGRNYIYYPPKKVKRSKSKSSSNIARISAIEKFLSQKPNNLNKTESFENLTKLITPGKFLEDNFELKLKKSMSKSLTDIEDFSSWSQNKGYKNDINPRDWITTVWDPWFDEIYPPLPENFDEISSGKILQSENIPTQEIITEVLPQPVVVIEITDLPEKIEPILEEVDKEFREEVIKTLYDEIENLTDELKSLEKPNAFLLTRRGSIFRKVGQLVCAFNDLNESIAIEPEFLAAYWERHLLYLICNKIQAAIEDLNYVLKKDANNVAAYKSRSNIYESLGDVSLAISNISKAIRLAPNDSDAYSKRAELYEKNGDHRLALEDYNKLIQLQPTHCLAMMKHGIYYLNIEQWQLAVQDFSNVLRYYPLNVEARLHRGTALTKLCQWQEAIKDFSAVIHLDPMNYLAYFKRGCLLRKAEPYLAIRDFSISLLLESTEENIMAYLYRGILYAQTAQYSEAIVDFEIVISFNKDMCLGHVNLGLVYYEKGDYEKTVKYMTSGLAADPTYIRAYVCRAEAFFKMNKYEEAIKDINRAIHIYPDRSNYYMLRGDFYLAMDKMEISAVCVKQAAAISQNLGQNPVQQALVYSFLQNYDKAVSALYQATRNKQSLDLLTLLGTTQMKAKRWEDSITTFSICLEKLKPDSPFKPWPLAAANFYFMTAQCYLELKNYKKSQYFFNATVKINTNYAEAFYHQGWCGLRLGKMKQGIEDLNRALAIKPNFYQAYLARAIYFGHKNQFTKAILNCNEVLVIEPRCIRAYIYRGVFKYMIKAYSFAVNDFTEALRIDPNCSLAYFNRAICFNAEKSKYQKAIQDYSIVLLVKNVLNLHYKSYINRGLVYLELGDIQNALNDFIKAQDIEKNNINVLYVIGLCHHKLKNLKEAIVIFSQCLEYDSNFLRAKVSRGNVFMDYNTPKGLELAVEDYVSVLEISPNNLEALVNLGFCLQVQGKFKKAWEIFTQAIEKHPTSERPLDGRAIVCMQMKDLNGSLKDLNDAIRLKPHSSILYTNRGVVYQLMHDGIRAMKDYNKAILIGGHQSQIAYYNIGCIYLHNFQLEQAFECFIKALDIDPLDEAAWMNLALIFIFRDKSEESLEYINKSITLAPNSAYLYFNRGSIFQTLKKYEEAENDFTTCLAIVPDNAEVHTLRGDCRNKLGDTLGALEDYKMSVYISSSNPRNRL